MKLILLVGPSGSGKDTLLRAVRRQFNGSCLVEFVRRYITRPPDSNEDNYYVDRSCFKILKHNGFFVSDWQAHGNEYGIPRNAISGSNEYQRLLCSVSRDAIGDFENFHNDVTVLQVTASKDVLRRRLQGRGRENPEDIEKRLSRAEHPVHAKDLIVFDNSTSLEQSQKNFICLVEKL